MKTNEEIRKLFNEKNGKITSEELLSFGLTHYSIEKLVKNGIIERIKRGTFMLVGSEEDEYYIIQQIITKSVLCLLSAANIYNYTTNIPNQYHLAIKSNYHPSLPEYPPIKLYYWRKKQFELGTIKMTLNGASIRIYNKEKTVCDFIKFRQKLDSNIVKEVLKSYLKDEERDLNKLKTYSKELKIEYVLNSYLNVLL